MKFGQDENKFGAPEGAPTDDNRPCLLFTDENCPADCTRFGTSSETEAEQNLKRRGFIIISRLIF